jgi:hypothetical protein
MRKWTRRATRGLAILLLIAASTSSPTARVEARPTPLPAVFQEEPPPSCCFTNRNYAGTCEVRPAKDESCSAILDYLNNPLSQGKTYCNNTNVRGGWQLVSCETKR